MYNKPYFIKIPGIVRIGIVLDRKDGEALMTGGLVLGSNLRADLYHDGKWQGFRELGSGLVTNVGVLALANDAFWPTAGPINTLKVANFHVSGTGNGAGSATAAAATDIKLQTLGAAGGQTAATGAQSLISAANVQKYRTVGTQTFTGTETGGVTEWGLMTSATITATTGSPFTAGAATTGTSTGAALTASSASVRGHTQFIVENTGNATPHWGLVTSNDTSIFTVPAWYKVSDGTAAGVTPANTNAYTIRPVMFDHKTFTVINVAVNDQVTYTYDLTINSGG